MPNEKTGLSEGEANHGQLAALVSYQAGAVVSRTLLKSAGGNLTLFAFDKDEGLSEHTTPHDALVWVLEGRVAVEIGDETFELGPGDFVRLPAQVPHALRALARMKMGLILFFS